jgi:6-phosphogluconate dehydrogenase
MRIGFIGLGRMGGRLGRGPLDDPEAIDRKVPAPIITLSLQARLRSRQGESYGAKVLAALRNECGGHAVGTEWRSP